MPLLGLHTTPHTAEVEEVMKAIVMQALVLSAAQGEQLILRGLEETVTSQVAVEAMATRTVPVQQASAL